MGQETECRVVALIPRQHTAHTLLGTLRFLRQNPGAIVRVRDIFPEQEYDLQGFKAWFLECLQRKITSQMPGYEVGRKWSGDWWRAAWNAARRVNRPRLIVRVSEVPLEFREQLRHRLTWPGEE